MVVGLGALADAVAWAVLPATVASAGATVVAVRALRRPPLARAVPAPGAAVLAVALAGTGFVLSRPDRSPPDDPPVRAGSLLVMSGITSSSGRGAIFDSDPRRLGFTCEQPYYFSYAGPGDGQPRGTAVCPITTGAPYEPDDTQRPQAEQVAAFAEQTRDLPRPVHVTTHSHGVWVAWAAVATGAAEVDAMILVGPFPDRVTEWPPAGEDGAGRVFGDLLRAAAPVADLVDFNFDPEAPAARELLADPGASRAILGRPVPAEVRTVSVTSATDLPLMPRGWRMDVDRNVCPLRVAHPYLPLAPQYFAEVQAFLDDAQGQSCPPWRDWGAAAARPFGLPAGYP
ncbi:MAG TPA: hypothetical protein PKB06_12585 [Actinotalea sp.]|nr:hypothetical protein [Actinotalea sp.]